MEERKEQYQRMALHIGSQMQKRRKKSALSLQELAEKMDVSHQQLHKYEKGLNSISADKLYFLAKTLDVPVSYFYEEFFDTVNQHSSGTKRGEALHILVVEDDPGDAILLKNALASCEKENSIHLVNDGRQALTYLNSRIVDKYPLPDLVFLDLNIPSIEGLALLKEVKKHGAMSHIPIIIVTSSMDDGDIVKSYKGQASGVIRKTGDRKAFNQHIASLVDCWSSAITLPATG